MAKQPLPKFKYHPNPLETRSIIESEKACVVCIKPRGYIYTGPTYGEDSYENEICPWCIADGSAHEELEVTFHDEAGIPGSDFEDAPEVDESIIEEITQRTPGFNAWQQEQWFTCCDDAAAFLGRMSAEKLESLGSKAKQVAQKSYWDELNPDDFDSLIEELDPESSPSLYMFQCLHCKKFGTYWDAD
ncbi:MAG TPA: CbrC family protein [Tepidisphaeraceae bacterium]|nr:CbrC family protein [Tepidisphaeraceae bacterium]